MRWEKGRRSTNVEDRRGRAVRRGATVGGGAVILALIAAFLLNQDPTEVLQQVGRQQSQQPTQQVTQRSAEENRVADFVSVVLADTEDTWASIFQQAGHRYQPAKLVLYTDSTPTQCGTGTAAAGPFYCPSDQKVYLDLSFLGQLQRMGAQGDFSVAYVIAHEIGHHIQTIVGTAQQVRAAQSRASRTQANAIQVRMELQADCYAGVWAHHAHKQRQILERGDIEEAMSAAAAVGDDRIMKSAGRRVRPESFTHGTSEQRMQWFRAGLNSGDINSCDTFQS